LIDRQFELNNKNVIVSVGSHTLFRFVSLTTHPGKKEKIKVILREPNLHFPQLSFQELENQQTNYHECKCFVLLKIHLMIEEI
jgi:hypothetical protein